MKPILFVGHSAGLTGAPILLLNFLSWLKQNSSIPFKIVLRETGSLSGAYASLADTLNLGSGPQGFIARRLRRLGLAGAANRLDLTRLNGWLSGCSFGLVYSNTVTNHTVLPALASRSPVIITHIHELENWISNHIDGDAFNATIKLTDRWIAVSNAVKDNLIQNHRVPVGQIDLVYEFIDTNNVTKVNIAETRTRMRNLLGIPEKAFIVCACGTTDWRKGPDLFIKLAHAISMRELPQPVYFIWVGGDPHYGNSSELGSRIRGNVPGEKVRFIGEKRNSQEYFAASDLFALTSREDPYPLVMLEAAALGLPIVCFHGSGGAVEFIEQDAGIAAPYEGFYVMAEHVSMLLVDSDLRFKMGQAARNKVRERHDIGAAAPKLLKIIEKYYSG